MIKKLIAVAVLSGVSSFGLACSKPEKPELPSADSAVLAQMVKAQKEVKKYLKLSEDYLSCEKNNKRHDGMVDEMNLVGADFNKLVKSYKARSVAAS